MSPEIKPLINTVKGLPFPYQLEILQEIAKSVSDNWKQIGSMDDFWHPRSVDEHLQANPVEKVSDIDILSGNFWPEDESADDFNQYTYGQRRSDRTAG